VSNIYQYQVLFGASRQRLKDAEVLLVNKRWNGAIYIGCYTVECILKCYLCRLDDKMNFQDTRFFPDFKGVTGHNILALFYAAGYDLERAKKIDRSGKLHQWMQAIFLLNDHTTYRYSSGQVSEEEAKNVIDAIKGIYRFIQERIERL